MYSLDNILCVIQVAYIFLWLRCDFASWAKFVDFHTFRNPIKRKGEEKEKKSSGKIQMERERESEREENNARRVICHIRFI